LREGIGRGANPVGLQRGTAREQHDDKEKSAREQGAGAPRSGDATVRESGAGAGR